MIDHLLQIRVLQIRVLQIHVLQIRVLQIQSVFYKSNPVRVLQYAFTICPKSLALCLFQLKMGPYIWRVLKYMCNASWRRNVKYLHFFMYFEKLLRRSQSFAQRNLYANL